MKNNTKILAWLLITGVAVTWVTFASTSTWSTLIWGFSKQKIELTEEQKTQMEEVRTLMEKQKNGETLTTEEQAKLDELKANMPQRWGWEGKWFWGKRWWEGKWEMMWFWGKMMDDLSYEEKAALESMTDEEKQTFFETKRTEQKAKMEARESVIDKLLAWETLTSDEEVVRQEIITQRAEEKVKRSQMEEVRTLMEKQKNGETLTTDEQTKIDELKVNITQRWEWRNKSEKDSTTSITE